MQASRSINPFLQIEKDQNLINNLIKEIEKEISPQQSNKPIDSLKIWANSFFNKRRSELSSIATELSQVVFFDGNEPGVILHNINKLLLHFERHKNYYPKERCEALTQLTKDTLEGLTCIRSEDLASFIEKNKNSSPALKNIKEKKNLDESPLKNLCAIHEEKFHSLAGIFDYCIKLILEEIGENEQKKKNEEVQLKQAQKYIAEYNSQCQLLQNEEKDLGREAVKNKWSTFLSETNKEITQATGQKSRSKESINNYQTQIQYLKELESAFNSACPFLENRNVYAYVRFLQNLSEQENSIEVFFKRLAVCWKRCTPKDLYNRTILNKTLDEMRKNIIKCAALMIPGSGPDSFKGIYTLYTTIKNHHEHNRDKDCLKYFLSSLANLDIPNMPENPLFALMLLPLEEKIDLNFFKEIFSQAIGIPPEELTQNSKFDIDLEQFKDYLDQELHALFRENKFSQHAERLMLLKQILHEIAQETASEPQAKILSFFKEFNLLQKRNSLNNAEGEKEGEKEYRYTP